MKGFLASSYGARHFLGKELEQVTPMTHVRLENISGAVTPAPRGPMSLLLSPSFAVAVLYVGVTQGFGHQ